MEEIRAVKLYIMDVIRSKFDKIVGILSSNNSFIIYRQSEPFVTLFSAVYINKLQVVSFQLAISTYSNLCKKRLNTVCHKFDLKVVIKY